LVPYRYSRPERDLEKELIDAVRQELTDSVATVGEYKEACGSLKVDFLGLSEYINKIIHDEEGKVFKKGGQEIALDKLTLTSQFQIAFDATAGTQHLLRIVPVLQPPVLGLTPDHTHSLKLTFAGKKGRDFKGNAPSLVQRCRDRFMGQIEALSPEERPARRSEVERVCTNPQTVLIESLIEAVENSKGGAASN
jgi:hypothetical protein